MASKPITKTAAIIVTYHPELGILKKLVEAISLQVDAVLVVDNGSKRMVIDWLQHMKNEAAHVILLGANQGIAAAQNVGINWAKERGAEFVLLLDHDSEPFDTMVENLLAAFDVKTNEGYQVAAIGPYYQDSRREKLSPFVVIKGYQLTRIPCQKISNIMEVDILISSGSLVRVDAIDAVGLMDEGLFIDYVDIEWTLRARQKGFRCYGACAAQMHHSLGESPVDIFGRQFTFHTPLRHYYLFRNAIWMYKQSWVPFRFKVADGTQLIFKYFFYSIFATPRYKHWQMMTRGIWHGLIGRMGKLQGRL